jgi:hypothetical protein
MKLPPRRKNETDRDYLYRVLPSLPAVRGASAPASAAARPEPMTATRPPATEREPEVIFTYKVTVTVSQKDGAAQSTSALEEDIRERLEDAMPDIVTIEAEDVTEETYEVTQWTAEPLYEDTV